MASAAATHLRPAVQPCRTLVSQAACCADLAASEAKPWRRDVGKRGRRVEAGPLGDAGSNGVHRSSYQVVPSSLCNRQARRGQRGRPPLQLAALRALGS